MQQKIRQLVHQGRLQFAGGGWTQNDEAVTHYSAILDNLSLGMKFIADNFGKSGKLLSGNSTTNLLCKYIYINIDW